MARRENSGKNSGKTRLATARPAAANKKDAAPSRSSGSHSLGDFLSASSDHVKIIGDDTGRAAAAQETLTAIRARGDRAIIIDPDGALIKNFYDPLRGDAILETQNWDGFGEIKEKGDIPLLVDSILRKEDNGIPNERFQEARTFLIDTMDRLWEAGHIDTQQNGRSRSAFHTFAEVHRVITQEPVGDEKISGLNALLAGTQSEGLLHPKNADNFSAVRAIAGSALQPFMHHNQSNIEPISVSNWVEQGQAGKGPGEGGFLFLHYKSNDHAARKSIAPAWLEQGIRAAMDKAPNENQRLWISTGDLNSIGKVHLLKDASTRLRKFGVRLVIEIDNKEAAVDRYGSGDFGALSENTRNTLIFSAREDTAKYAASLIGEGTVLSSPGHDWGKPKTTRDHPRPNWAQIIENLPDKTGLLRTSADPLWRTVVVGSKVSEATSERDVSRRSAPLRQKVVKEHYKGRPGAANPSATTPKDKTSEKESSSKNKRTRNDDGHTIQ